MRLLAFSCVSVVLALLPLQCRAVDRLAALQQALGSPDPLYKFSPGALEAGVKLCAANDPGHAGEYVALALTSGRVDADMIAPAIVKAAIAGLGDNPPPDRIGGIIRSAVKATPSEVLDIVTAAVKASPRGAAPAIVQAAVQSVPHPEQLVNVNDERRSQRVAGIDKQADSKQFVDGKALPAEQKQMTLAEAIVQAALDADPGLSADALTASVDTGITFNPQPSLTEVLAPIPILPPISSGNFGAPGPVSP